MVSRSPSLNINVIQDNPSWLLVTLPVGSGGLGFRSTSHLSLSAFLVSTDGAFDLMHQVLPLQISSVPYHAKDLTLSTWQIALPVDAPLPTTTNWQKSLAQHQLDTLLTSCTDPVSQSRLLGANSKESGAWLHVPPISSLGLHMSDDVVCTAIGLRVGAPICLPRTCSSCEKQVNELAFMA